MLTMQSNGQIRLAIAGVLCAAAVWAQDAPLSRDSISFNLPKDSPVTVLSIATDQSRTTMRGAAMVLDLHMSLTLRNGGPGRIHGITLRVVSQEVAMGGKGSVTVPSLNIAPGRRLPGADRYATRAAHPNCRRTAGARRFRRRFVPGFDLFRPRSAQFAPVFDRLRAGSAARPDLFQARSRAVRQRRPAAADDRQPAAPVRVAAADA